MASSLNPRDYVANEAGLRDLTKKYGPLTRGQDFFATPSAIVFESPVEWTDADVVEESEGSFYEQYLTDNIRERETTGAWKYDFQHGLREPWSPIEELLLDVWHQRIKYDDLLWKIENKSTKLLTEPMVEYYLNHLSPWVDQYEAAVRLVENYAGVGAYASPGVALTEEEQQSLMSCFSSLDRGFRQPDLAAVNPENDCRCDLQDEELSVIDKAISVFFERHQRKHELHFAVIAQDVYKTWLYELQETSHPMITRQEMVAFREWITSQYPSPAALRKRLHNCRQFLIGAVRDEQRSRDGNKKIRPFLGLELDVTQRTVRRNGCNLPITINGTIVEPG